MTRAEIILALRLALSAFAAIAIAALLQVPHPFWAAMPVWAMSQPTRGLVLERGLFRLLGTLVGAAAGLGLLTQPLPFQARLLLLSISVFALTALVARLRGALGYAPLMTALTLCIVVIPGLVHPLDALGFAVARVECTMIGVVVGLLMGFFLTPRADQKRFSQSLVALAARVQEFSVQVLLRGQAAQDSHDEQQLVSALRLAQEEASIIGAGSLAGHQRVAEVQELAQCAFELLAAVKAHELRLRHVPLPRPARESFACAAERLCAPQAGDHRAAFDTVAQQDPRLAHALAALCSSVHDWQRELRPAGRPARAGVFSPYRDAGLALEAGLVAAVCTYAAVMLAAATQLPQAEWAALGFALSGIMLGSHPSPARVAGVVLRGALAGSLVALVYRLLVMPHVHSTTLLLVSLLPLLLVGGFARAVPRLSAPAFDANQLFLLSSAASVPGMPAGSEVWAGTAALVVSIVVSCYLFPRLAPSPERRRNRLSTGLSRALDNAVAGLSRTQRMPVSIQHFFHLGSVASLVLGGPCALSAYNTHSLVARLRSLHSSGDSSDRHLLEQALAVMRAPADASPGMVKALDQQLALASSLRLESRLALHDAVAAIRGEQEVPRAV